MHPRCDFCRLFGVDVLWPPPGWDKISPVTSKLADIPVSRVRIIESNTTWRKGRGNPIRVFKICNPRRGLPSHGCRKPWTQGWDSESLPLCGDWLFFSFLSKNGQNMSKTHTSRDFSRLFGVDVLWRHSWITSGMGLSHPPGWDNISPDVKIGGFSCLKSENL